jgi:hypothetical protein
MNQLAGETGVVEADILGQGFEISETQDGVEDCTEVHDRKKIDIVDEAPDDEDEDIPELEDNMDEDSDDEAEVNDESKKAEFLGDGGEAAVQELYDMLEETSSDSDVNGRAHQLPLRRSERTTAGVKRKDEANDWNFMNLSVSALLNEFGTVASDACKSELTQLFIEKQALVPVKWEELTREQQKKAVRSHMFLSEKYEVGVFDKMKARLLVDGRMQDRSVYHDYSSPTAKTKLVMTCLELAALKGWDMLKLDIRGAFLCDNIDDSKEVFMILDKKLSEMCGQWVPGAGEIITKYGKLVVKVNIAMYGLIQSAKLWYKELSGYLTSKGFKAYKSNECVLVKRMENGKHMWMISLCYRSRLRTGIG